MQDYYNLYVLNAHRETIGILSNRIPFSLPFYEDLQERDLDDLTDTLTFKVPANHVNSSLIQTDNHILYPSYGEGYRLYKIKEVTENSDGNQYAKEVYAEISAQDDLIKDVVRPMVFNSATLNEILAAILVGTDWSVGNVADLGYKDYEIKDYPTKLKAIVDVVKSFGGELEFEYEMLRNTATVLTQQVSVYEELGEKTGKIFTHGLDVKGVERVENTDKLITALIAVGKSDGDGVPLTLSEHEVLELGVLPKGYEKPIGADWIGSTTALEKYGTRGEHIFGVYKDDKAQSLNELFSNTLKTLQQYEKPLMTYKVDVALLEKLSGYEAHKVRIGDTITIQDNSVKPGLYVTARVRRLSRSITNPLNDKVELGDYLPIAPSIDNQILEIQSTIREKSTQWTEAKEVAVAAKEVAATASDKATTAQVVASSASAKADVLETKVTEVEKNVTYKVDIISTNGQIFKNGVISTTLLARVYHGTQDVTDTIDANRFRWTRVSLDTSGDTAWNTAHFGGTKTITINTNDVKNRATFNCEILES